MYLLNVSLIKRYGTFHRTRVRELQETMDSLSNTIFILNWQEGYSRISVPLPPTNISMWGAFTTRNLCAGLWYRHGASNSYQCIGSPSKHRPRPMLLRLRYLNANLCWSASDTIGTKDFFMFFFWMRKWCQIYL